RWIIEAFFLWTREFPAYFGTINHFHPLNSERLYYFESPFISAIIVPGLRKNQVISCFQHQYAEYTFLVIKKRGFYKACKNHANRIFMFML
ncbi:MAG: hypothetical protein ACYCX4_17360, partial [Bacillota bacterium]